MDYDKLGNLVLQRRKDMGMTQRQLADAMQISDKTISKWERGLGCPDVSLLSELSRLLGVNIERILSGELDPKEAEGGNMKQIKFYVCPNCGNIMTSVGEADISCCGRTLIPLAARAVDEEHNVSIEAVEDEDFITFEHDMTKAHYISFVAYVSYDRVLLVKLYPEQNGELRIPRMRGGKLYLYCSQHGLMMRAGNTRKKT